MERKKKKTEREKSPRRARFKLLGIIRYYYFTRFIFDSEQASPPPPITRDIGFVRIEEKKIKNTYTRFLHFWSICTHSNRAQRLPLQRRRGIKEPENKIYAKIFKRSPKSPNIGGCWNYEILADGVLFYRIFYCYPKKYLPRVRGYFSYYTVDQRFPNPWSATQ